MKNVFGKAMPLARMNPEKMGAIDDITAILVVLNPKIHKEIL